MLFLSSAGDPSLSPSQFPLNTRIWRKCLRSPFLPTTSPSGLFTAKRWYFQNEFHWEKKGVKGNLHGKGTHIILGMQIIVFRRIKGRKYFEK